MRNAAGESPGEPDPEPGATAQCKGPSCAKVRVSWMDGRWVRGTTSLFFLGAFTSRQASMPQALWPKSGRGQGSFALEPPHPSCKDHSQGLLLSYLSSPGRTSISSGPWLSYTTGAPIVARGLPPLCNASGIVDTQSTFLSCGGHGLGGCACVSGVQIHPQGQ